MTRLTNIARVLVTLSLIGAAMGCSVIVSSKLDEKGDGGSVDSGPQDSGADTGETIDCRLETDPTAFCSSFECIEDGECRPDSPDADPATGCVFGASAPEGEECEGFRFDDETFFMGMCDDGFCAGCGDGEMDAGEDCDDENSINGDGCENDCTFTCRVDTDCDFDCAAPRRCDPATPGALKVCLPVSGATLPPMGTECEVVRVGETPLMGMCDFRTGGELCCGPIGPMGRTPCCGIFAGESTVRCQVVMLPPPP